jgi:hypothetical protein
MSRRDPLPRVRVRPQGASPEGELSTLSAVPTTVTAQVSGFRVQAINEERGHGSIHPATWTIGAGGDPTPATTSFLNPEPLTFAT